MYMSENIVITGEGIVSAIGKNKQETVEALLAGQTGIGEIRYLDTEHKELPAGEVKMSNSEMKSLLGFAESDEINRTTLMGIIAVRQALHDAGISTANVNGRHRRIVLISGTTVGGMDITEKRMKDILAGVTPADCLKSHDAGSSTDRIAGYFGIFSDRTTISTACSSAANAMIVGANMIKAGVADIVVAGGAEALTKFHLNGFNSLMILDRQMCRPFDETRAGLNLGEGAAFVVMEAEETAIERGVPIHAFLTGYGNACDAFHQTASSDNGEGAYLAMCQALQMANLKPTDIQYINAHGTGTPNNDLSESVAMKRVFGEEMPLVSSTKSFTGHTTSASGSIEAVICLLAMRDSFVPGNLGWKNPMAGGIKPTLGIAHCSLENVLCNSFGFGGNDSSLILSRYPHPDGKYIKYGDDCIEVVAEVEVTSEEELSEIRDYVKPIEARRMGKLMKASMLTSLKALRIAGVETPDAIVTATALGCLENSEKLLFQMLDEGEVMLKPTYFMQSTHNTLSSSVAIRTHCHGYNITYTQGRESLEWALRDARLLLRSGKCNIVLVGCHDESTPTFSALTEKAGMDSMIQVYSKSIVLRRK